MRLYIRSLDTNAVRNLPDHIARRKVEGEGNEAWVYITKPEWRKVLQIPKHKRRWK